MKAFEDETVYDAQTIPSSEEASLDAFPSEQDSKSGTLLCLMGGVAFTFREGGGKLGLRVHLNGTYPVLKFHVNTANKTQPVLNIRLKIK